LLTPDSDSVRSERPSQPPESGSVSRDSRADWLKALVNCLAWAYPAFWTANSLLNGVPAVLQVCFRGHYFGWVNVSEWGIRAVSFPGGVAGPIMERRTASILGEMLIPIALMAGVLLLLYWLRWKRHLLGGVFAAMLGEAG